MKNSYKFFRNYDCDCFPCHDGIDPERFNCLFCYCPLYLLDKRCIGQFVYTNRNVKCCTQCSIPHEPNNYDVIVAELKKEINQNAHRDD